MTANTLQARLAGRLQSHPGERAIAYIDPRGQFAWKTRAGFLAEGAGAAARLVESGLKPGDVCIIDLPSGETSARFLLGALMAGALPLMIAPPSLQKFNSDLLEIFLRNVQRTRARVVVHDDSLEPVIEEARKSAPKTTFVSAAGGPPPALASDAAKIHQPDPDGLAGMQLTSGTTGFPRICMWKHAGVLAALDGMGDAMGVTDDDVCFNWTPLYHDMGLVNNFYLCMTRGLPMVLQSPNDFVKSPARWLRGLHLTGSTVTWSPNFGYALAAQRVTDEEMQGVRLEGVRQFWNAAERIHLDSVEAFFSRFAPYGVSRKSLKMNFGCAENVGGATFTPPQESFVAEWIDRKAYQEKRIARRLPAAASHEGTMAVVGCGKPHALMTIKIVSPRGKFLPDGHIGEIALHTPSRLEGFLKDAPSTRHARFGEYLRTGDMGYMRGNELFWTGRMRERIVMRGKKFDPSDFERALLKIKGLRKGCFAAFGHEDEANGTQKLVILMEPADENPADAPALIRAAREEVFKYLDVTPGEIVLVRPGTLTKTSSGKRRHRHFAKMYREGGLEPFLIARG